MADSTSTHPELNIRFNVNTGPSPDASTDIIWINEVTD